MAATKTSGITPKTIRYGNGITATRALPKAKGKRPAVIILHERYGIDQHTKDLAARLAQAGFVGLAPDLFHRFAGDRKAVLRGEQRVDLTDDGAPHGWLNDTMPGRYRKEAAKDAWNLMMAFLRKCFAGGWDKDKIICRYESEYSNNYDFGKNVRLE